MISIDWEYRSEMQILPFWPQVISSFPFNRLSYYVVNEILTLHANPFHKSWFWLHFKRFHFEFGSTIFAWFFFIEFLLLNFFFYLPSSFPKKKRKKNLFLPTEKFKFIASRQILEYVNFWLFCDCSFPWNCRNIIIMIKRLPITWAWIM